MVASPGSGADAVSRLPTRAGGSDTVAPRLIVRVRQGGIWRRGLRLRARQAAKQSGKEAMPAYIVCKADTLPVPVAAPLVFYHCP